MLKLTQVIKGYPDQVVYIAKNHIVAIYPDREGNGCHIELTTNTDPDQHILQVKESAEVIVHWNF